MTDDTRTQKTPRRARGLARIWTDADIARMTRVTKFDVANAMRWWHKHCPPRYRKLLEARQSKRDRGNDET